LVPPGHPVYGQAGKVGLGVKVRNAINKLRSDKSIVASALTFASFRHCRVGLGVIVR
jgi:hypothetical protein